MVCLGRNRRAVPALLASLRIRRTAVFFTSLLRWTFVVMTCWITLLTSTAGWARPRPYRNGYWMATGWYQNRRGAAGNSGGHSGAQGRSFAPLNEQQHLGPWLNQHRNMSLGAQERALRNEPGFNRLPPATQQRLFKRLQQLSALPPAQRARTLDRLETWERLSPGQRQQVRNGIQQVNQMPLARQQMMHRAVRDLSEFPPDQRQSILNSPQFRHQFSDNERQVLGTLMLAQPYTPLRSR